MYAIIENKGKQLKVAKDSIIKIDKLDAKSGDKITFDNVLLLTEGEKI